MEGDVALVVDPLEGGDAGAEDPLAPRHLLAHHDDEQGAPEGGEDRRGHAQAASAHEDRDCAAPDRRHRERTDLDPLEDAVLGHEVVEALGPPEPHGRHHQPHEDGRGGEGGGPASGDGHPAESKPAPR